MKASLPILVFIPLLTCLCAARGAPVRLVEQPPVSITQVAPDVCLVDFGRVAFGNLLLLPPANAAGHITVDFGEALSAGRIEHHPPGSVCFAQSEVTLQGDLPEVIAPAPDQRNTSQPQAVLTPPAWGTLLPYRWVEITGWPGGLRAGNLRRQAAFASGWDDRAAAFHCSDEMLDRIWELCRYSIKATTFAGVYVDGNRERTSYEADAYLDQLGQYYTDGGVQMARDTFDRLLAQPTWPTEWASHLIFMAHSDYLQTGDTNWLAAHYAALIPKLHLGNVRSDGLLVSSEAKIEHGDLVDWPRGERDGFVFRPVNTVENAFYLHALADMTDLARVLHEDANAADFALREQTGRDAFQKELFDPARGLYRDGEGTGHLSLHANLFPLAFGLVPEAQRASVSQWLSQRGMVCSVYAAQFLLESLFENNCATQALALITAPGDRSWRHMVDSGATITWEAWDQRYKPNLDWNHAWGAAPANLLPRFVLGVQPLSPGWTRATIRPDPGPLKFADGKVPTPLGPIYIAWKYQDTFQLSLKLPPGMTAKIQLPAINNSAGVVLGGTAVSAHREGPWWILDRDVSGTVTVETIETR